MTHTNGEDTEKITMAPTEEYTGFDTCNATNMVAELDCGPTAGGTDVQLPKFVEEDQ